MEQIQDEQDKGREEKQEEDQQDEKQLEQKKQDEKEQQAEESEESASMPTHIHAQTQTHVRAHVDVAALWPLFPLFLSPLAVCFCLRFCLSVILCPTSAACARPPMVNSHELVIPPRSLSRAPRHRNVYF